MISKNSNKKKFLGLKNIKSLVPKKINLEKIKVNPVKIIDKTKSKIENYYVNIKLGNSVTSFDNL